MYYLLGIDAGTTSFKAALFDENGKIVSSAAKAYKLLISSNSIVEYEAEGYWRILKDVIKDLIQKSGIAPSQIKALAVDSQGETIIPVDKCGNPLCNAIVWMDNRSVDEACAIESEFGVKSVYEITGQPQVSATWPATKILWLRRNNPDLFNKTHKFLLLEDYILFKLTGKYRAERSLLSSTIYLDINTGLWWKEMLRFIGIDEGRLPEIMDSAQCVGELTEKAADELGLDKSTLAVTGALDQAAGTIGAGNIGREITTETTGTCLGVCVNTDSIPKFNSQISIPCHIHAIPGRYFLVLWSQAAGSVLEWFRNNFYNDETSYKLIDMEAEEVPPGSEGLLMLPHLSGVACPDFNPYAKGVFYGISHVHKRGHFARAIMESIAYMLKEHIDMAETLGIKTGEIRSLGGGAQSSLWNRIKADVTGKEIKTLECQEATCLGAAILAGAGIGMFGSIEEACKKFVSTRESYLPDAGNNSIYNKSYDAYRKLYGSLKEMYLYY